MPQMPRMVLGVVDFRKLCAPLLWARYSVTDSLFYMTAAEEGMPSCCGAVCSHSWRGQVNCDEYLWQQIVKISADAWYIDRRKRILPCFRKAQEKGVVRPDGEMGRHSGLKICFVKSFLLELPSQKVNSDNSLRASEL